MVRYGRNDLLWFVSSISTLFLAALVFGLSLTVIELKMEWNMFQTMDGNGIDEFVDQIAMADCVEVSTTRSGTEFQLRSGNSGSGMAKEFFYPLSAGNQYGFYSTPPQDPMLPALLSQTPTISSVRVRDFFASSQQSIPDMSNEDISNALASSQEFATYARNDTFLAFIRDMDSQSVVPPSVGERKFSVKANPVTYSANTSFDVVDTGRVVSFFGAQPSSQTPVTMHDPDLVDRSSATQKDVVGDYGFSISFPQYKGQKESVYEANEKLLFVKISSLFEVQFAFTKVPPSGSLLRVRAVFEVQGQLNNPVIPCISHKGDGNNSYLYTDEKKTTTNSAKAEIIFPLIPPKNAAKKNGWSHVSRLGLRCWNSCFKSKTQIGLIFELVIQGHVVGNTHINVRVCACPDRDSKITTKTKRENKGKKRKMDDVVKSEPDVPTVGQSMPECSGASGKLMSSCIEQTYGQNPDGSLWLKQVLVVSPNLKLFVDQLIATGNIVDYYTKKNSSGEMQIVPSPLPVAQGTIPVKLEDGRGDRDRNAGEIRRWLRTVCHSNLITEDIFLEAGRPSLSEVFKMTREELDAVLGGELVPEVVAKIWLNIQDKEYPAPSSRITSLESQSRSGSGLPTVDASPAKKRAKLATRK